MQILQTKPLKKSYLFLSATSIALTAGYKIYTAHSDVNKASHKLNQETSTNKQESVWICTCCNDSNNEDCEKYN